MGAVLVSIATIKNAGLKPAFFVHSYLPK